MINNQAKTDKARTASARPFSASAYNSRPQSGNKFLRKQLIQNTYTPGHSRMRASSAKSLITIKQASTVYDTEKVKKVQATKKKPREEMVEQIMGLKLKVNDLVKQLGHQRGKTEEMRKKHNKFARVLNVEFENERVWNAGVLNSHRVEGMRCMYDKLKDEHQQLKEDYDRLQKNIKVTKELEYIRYIEVLETELRSVHQRFDKIAQNSLQLLAHQNDYESQANLHLLGQTQHQYKQLNQRYNKLKAKYQMCTENIKDRNKKVDFLDRYTCELENKINSMEKNHASRERQQKRMNEERQIALAQAELSRDKALQELQILKIQINQSQEQALAQRNKIVREKQQRIDAIIKENNYYQQMIKELRKTNNDISKECQQLKKRQVSNAVVGKFAQVVSNSNAERQKASRVNSSQGEKGSISLLAGLLSGKRVRQTADKKCSENAVKKRRIQQSQIKEITSLLRLKFIGKNIRFSQILTLLSYKSNSQLNEQENQWKQQHISMQQIKLILESDPFSLHKEQSQILARYIIEDVQEQHVYVDLNNQNYRSIVKSILKAELGEYRIVQKDSQLQNEIKLFFKRYSSNLQSILTSIEPGGTIPRKRFVDTLNSLGVQYSDEMLDGLLGMMAVEAESLSALCYPALFQHYGQQ